MRMCARSALAAAAAASATGRTWQMTDGASDRSAAFKATSLMRPLTSQSPQLGAPSGRSVGRRSISIAIRWLKLSSRLALRWVGVGGSGASAHDPRCSDRYRPVQCVDSDRRPLWSTSLNSGSSPESKRSVGETHSCSRLSEHQRSCWVDEMKKFSRLVNSLQLIAFNADTAEK